MTALRAELTKSREELALYREFWEAHTARVKAQWDAAEARRRCMIERAWAAEFDPATMQLQ